MKILYKSQAESWGGLYQHLSKRLERLLGKVEIVCDPGPHFLDHADAQVVIPTSVRVSAGVLAELPKLRLIQQPGAGLEGIDIRAAQNRGIAIASIPTDVSGAADAVAEHVLGLMLAMTRKHREFPEALAHRALGCPVASSLDRKSHV